MASIDPYPLNTIPLHRGDFVKTVVEGAYDKQSVDCIESATRKLIISDGHPVMLLGKVQSGKTRTFLGIVSYCFDNDFDLAVVLTKGTRALAMQTLRRLQTTFQALADDDKVRIYDIMHVPANLPARDLKRKILLVVKKEDDNLRRLEEFLFRLYPELGRKRVLIVDDEADLASVGYRGSKKTGVRTAAIAGQIGEIRSRLVRSAFLQVTATPYALYLQPEASTAANGSCVIQPLRPAFTEIVPIHSHYVGGDTYFVASEVPGSVESFMHVEVEEREFDALKKQDGRRLKLTDVMTSANCAALRQAILDFLVGAAIRRLHQATKGERKKRYSMVVHTEHARAAHEWQFKVASAIVQELESIAHGNDGFWTRLLEASLDRFRPALEAAAAPVPDLSAVSEEARDLVEGVRVQRVNSDEDVSALLGDDGQLRLESALTVFIGGQILDRGVTIENLIAFYYGRNPRSFQQDTVLQHSRMYGARPKDDLPVTRFYTSRRLHEVMRRIHEFDHALRTALESGHDQGVAFIREERGRIRPCAPSKVMISTLTSLTPGKRLLPVGFQTKAPSTIQRHIAKLDQKIDQLSGLGNSPRLVEAERVCEAVSEALSLLDLSDPDCVFDEKAFLAAIRYLSDQCADPAERGKVLLLVRRGRRASRQYQSGRFSNTPWTGQDAETAKDAAVDVPLVMLLRQQGGVAEGWRGAPFWWPVLQAPQNTRPVVFSADILSDDD